MRTLVITLLLLFGNHNSLACNMAESTNDEIVRFATAPGDGAYTDVATAIQALLLECDGIKSELIASAGSVENWDLTDSGKVELSLIQSDILHDRTVESSFTNVGAIAALFPEYIQILVLKKNQFKYRNLLKLSGKKIYIGRAKSGTESNAKLLLSSSNLNRQEIINGNWTSVPDYIPIQDYDRLTAMKKLESEEIDAMIITSGIIDFDKRFHQVGLNDSFSEQLIDQYPYLSRKALREGFQTEYILFTRAVLTASTASSNFGQNSGTIKTITQSIYDNWPEIEKNTETQVQFFPRELIARKVAIELHPGAKSFYFEAGVLKTFGAIHWSIIILITFIVITGFLRLFFIKRPWMKPLTITDKFDHLRERPIVNFLVDFYVKLTCAKSWLFFVWLVVWLISIIVLIIIFSEESYAHRHDVVNPFAGKGPVEIVFWLLTFAVTGFNQNIFPNSLLAQVSAIVIPVAAVIGALIIVVYQIVEKDRRHEKEQRGELLPNLKRAVVICGWNDRVPNLIKNLLANSSPTRPFKEIVIIAEIDEEKPLEKFNIALRNVKYYRGISSSYKLLLGADIESSYCTVVMADDKKIKMNDNQRSLLTVSAVKEITGRNSDKRYPIIAEAYFHKNIDTFKDYAVNRLICLRSYTERMILHAVLNPGVSDLLLNLLSYDPPYRLEEIKRGQHHFGGMRYDELALELREKENKQLVSIYRHSKEHVHDSFELNFHQTNSPYKLATDISISKSQVEITDNDSLIVLETISSNKKHKGDSELVEQLQLKSFEAIDDNKENIWVIGRSIIAESVCNQLANRVENVTFLNTSGNTEVDNDNNFSTITNQGLEGVLEGTGQEILSATRVVIIAPPMDPYCAVASVYQDDESFKVVSIIRTYFRKRRVKLPHIVSEIRNLDNRHLFYNAGVHQLIPSNTLIELLLTRMVYHNGRISGFIIKSMSYDSENTLSRIEKWSVTKLNRHVQDVIGATFDKVLTDCLDLGIQLLAIESESENETSDNDSFIRKKLIINPKEEYKLQITDKVYIFTSPVSVDNNIGNKSISE